MKHKIPTFLKTSDEREETLDNGVEDGDQSINLDANILLVENEIVNQMVATEMLEGLGCVVTLAENGQEAVDKLIADNVYDIILMDCMMPVMDGFEATQEIRRLEDKGELSKQTIIAMTANAMAGEKDKCIDVGMDDYLSKPVKSDVLHRKLSEYLHKPMPLAAAQ